MSRYIATENCDDVYNSQLDMDDFSSPLCGRRSLRPGSGDIARHAAIVP
jgi:hypothetical protein